MIQISSFINVALMLQLFLYIWSKNYRYDLKAWYIRKIINTEKYIYLIYQTFLDAIS